VAKVKKVFSCSNCGSNSPKWIGKCPSCNEWNTYHEEVISKETKRESQDKVWKNNAGGTATKPIPLPQIKVGTTQRLITPDQELNRVLGGGIVAGSVVLIGGQPGIGKSTLLLQIALTVKAKILYVSGEESEEQIKMRADRIGQETSDCYILTETNTVKILKHATELKPDLMVIDSMVFQYS